MNELKKTIHVVAAIIVEDGRLFATQRGYGEWKDWWEFPGGKIEGTFEQRHEKNGDDANHNGNNNENGNENNNANGNGNNDANGNNNDNDNAIDNEICWVPTETPQEALKREIREELLTEIEVGELLTTVEYDYPKFHLSMQCYLCRVVAGELTLHEHEDARWLTKEELDSVRWLPADIEILPMIAERID